MSTIFDCCNEIVYLAVNKLRFSITFPRDALRVTIPVVMTTNENKLTYA